MIRSIVKTIGWPLATIIAGLILFPLGLSALEVLANPQTQIRDIQIKWMAGQSGSVVRIHGDHVFLQIPDSLATPEDRTCRKAAELFHRICSLDPGLTLHVSRLTPEIIWTGSGDRDAGEDRIINDWIPSAKNPMTVEWTRRLVNEGDCAG